jgi:hypothetical protein
MSIALLYNATTICWSLFIYLLKIEFFKHMVLFQGFQSGPVPGTFTRLRSCIVPAEITGPPKISGGQNHKYDSRLACGIFFIKN